MKRIVLKQSTQLGRHRLAKGASVKLPDRDADKLVAAGLAVEYAAHMAAKPKKPAPKKQTDGPQ